MSVYLGIPLIALVGIFTALLIPNLTDTSWDSILIPPADKAVQGETAVGTIAGGVVGGLIGVVLFAIIIVVMAIVMVFRLRRSDSHTNG